MSNLRPVPGRILDRKMVEWVIHLLLDTTWEPNREAAGDLLATIWYLLDQAETGQPVTLPPQTLLMGKDLPPQQLDATGQPVQPDSPKVTPLKAVPGKGRRRAPKKRGDQPQLTLLPHPEPPSVTD